MAPAPVFSDHEFAVFLSRHWLSTLVFADDIRWSSRAFWTWVPLDATTDACEGFSPRLLVRGMIHTNDPAVPVEWDVWVRRMMDLNSAVERLEFFYGYTGDTSEGGLSPQAFINHEVLSFVKHPSKQQFGAVIACFANDRSFQFGTPTWEDFYTDVRYIIEEVVKRCSEATGIPLTQLIQEFMEFGIQKFPPSIVNLYLQTWLPLMYRNGYPVALSHISFLEKYKAARFERGARRFLSELTTEFGGVIVDENEYTIDATAFIRISNMVLVRSADPWAVAKRLSKVAAVLGCSDQMEALLEAIRVCEREFIDVRAVLPRDMAYVLAQKLGKFVERLI